MTQRPQPPPSGPQIPLELADDVAQGQYANLFFATHSPSEFVLDFARLLPGARKAIVYSRVVLTPQHARALLEVLEKNITAFEEQYGAIKVPGKTANDPRIGFAPNVNSYPPSDRE